MTACLAPPVRQAAVLVGGLGTRLGALTAHTPKPLLPAGDRPFLSWVLRELCRYGVEEILLLAGHLAHEVEAALPGLRRRLPRPLTLRLLTEPMRAGTGGALLHARAALDARFLLCNGDTLVEGSLAGLIADAASDPAEVAGRLLVCHVADPGRYGAVEVEGDLVTRFAERPSGAAPLVNTGVAVLSRDLPVTAACSLEREILPALAASGALRASVADGAFLDIGVPEDFARAAQLGERLRRPALFLDRDGVLNVDHGHVASRDRLDWIEGAAAAVALAHRAGRHVFVVTNQGGVARGLHDEAAVAALHRHMQAVLLAQGATVDDWRHCPHHPEGVVARYAIACACRKPGPGMLRDLLRDWEVRGPCDLIGDRNTDLAAAAAAGVRGTLFQGGDLARVVAGVL